MLKKTYKVIDIEIIFLFVRKNNLVFGISIVSIHTLNSHTLTKIRYHKLKITFLIYITNKSIDNIIKCFHASQLMLYIIIYSRDIFYYYVDFSLLRHDNLKCIFLKTSEDYHMVNIILVKYVKIGYHKF